MKQNKLTYFDNYQITPISESVKKAITKELDENILPSLKFTSQGAASREKVHIAKELIAKSIGASPDEIFFTREGTTANNLIVRGVVENHLKQGKKLNEIELIVDKISCPDIYAMHKYYEQKGAIVKYLEVDEKGNVKLDDLKQKLSNKTVLVSITHYNQIIGTIQPIEQIAKITKDYNKNILVNIEGQLSYFKTKINLENIDFFVMSAYKIHGPLISAFYKSKSATIEAILNGRGMSIHEVGFANIPYIVGFGQAVKDKLEHWEIDLKHIKQLRDYALNRITKEISDVEIYGPSIDENRDPANLLASFKYVEGESIYMDLSFENIIVNTTSACAQENLKADYVILSIGKKHEDSHGSLRITFSKYNTKDDVDKLVEALKKSVTRIREMSSFKSDEYSYDKIKTKNAKCKDCGDENCEVNKKHK